MSLGDDLKSAHRSLARAAGKVALMIARKGVIRGELTEAADLASEAAAVLATARDALPPSKQDQEQDHDRVHD